jgi:acyl-coenzyme A thioesterase PaaI-like protein
MVTAKLEVSYKKPTPTDVPLTVIGRVIEQRKKSARVEGEIRLADGTLTATCTAIVVMPPQEFLNQWDEEKRFWYVNED